jgi:hypothetical protein
MPANPRRDSSGIPLESRNDDVGNRRSIVLISPENTLLSPQFHGDASSTTEHGDGDGTHVDQ